MSLGLYRLAHFLFGFVSVVVFFLAWGALRLVLAVLRAVKAVPREGNSFPEVQSRYRELLAEHLASRSAS